MTELKTLKDLDIYAEFSANTRDKISIQKLNLISADELKQEAIKWVEHNKNLERAAGFINDREELILKTWIKHFFNITDEDIQLNEKSEEK